MQDRSITFCRTVFPFLCLKVTSIAVCVSHRDPVSIDVGDCELVISKELRNSEIEGKN